MPFRMILMIIEKSAGLIIYRLDNGKTCFLLLRYGWGHWGFPKGIIESGETEMKAAIREANEETGLYNFKFFKNFREKIEYFKRGKSELSNNSSFRKKTLPRSFGIGSECVCQNCGYRFSHVPGQPCIKTVCINCGKTMIRG